jgi:hypothetical protein
VPQLFNLKMIAPSQKGLSLSSPPKVLCLSKIDHAVVDANRS